MKKSLSMPTNLPISLQEGDLVDLIYPGCGCTQEDIISALAIIESWGLKSRVAQISLGNDPLCADHDEIRLASLTQALTASDSKAVWCMRGGYGATRLMPGLRILAAPNKEKLFIGFSDNTAIHLFLNQEWGWSSLHAPVGMQLGTDYISDATQNRLQQTLFNQLTENDLKLSALNTAAEAVADINAPIVGGNVALVQASLGTYWQCQTKGKILFLEEVGERGYQLDRMLTQISQAGLLDEVKAVLFGTIVGVKEKDGQDHTPFVLERFAQSLNVPVFQTNQVGHGKENYPLLLGATVAIK